MNRPQQTRPVVRPTPAVAPNARPGSMNGPNVRIMNLKTLCKCGQNTPPRKRRRY